MVAIVPIDAEANLATSSGVAPTLGERVLTLRRKRGWTQDELADRLGLQKHAILRWEKGRNLPRSETLHQLAAVLGTTPSYLLTGEEEAGASPQVVAARKYVAARRVDAETAAYLEDAAKTLERHGRQPDDHFFSMVALAYSAHTEPV